MSISCSDTFMLFSEFGESFEVPAHISIHVVEEKGMVACVITVPEFKIKVREISRCNPCDKWDSEFGIDLATSRAMNKLNKVLRNYMKQVIKEISSKKRLVETAYRKSKKRLNKEQNFVNQVIKNLNDEIEAYYGEPDYA